jgi:hypothetical protein
MRFDFIGVMECLTSDGCHRRNILFQGEAGKNVACSERCVQLIFCCNVCMYVCTLKVNFCFDAKEAILHLMDIYTVFYTFDILFKKLVFNYITYNDTNEVALCN